MTRRGWIGALLAAVATGAALTAAAAAAPGVRLAQVGRVHFPDRAFVLTSPRPLAIKGGRVSVFENDKRVELYSLVPAKGAAKGKFGVVVVIDTSLSMHGSPIAAAFKAAQAFVQRRAPNEEIGLLTFNSRVRVELEPTASKSAVASALAAASRLAYGTHIYDAVDRAIGLLEKSRVPVGSIVLLSDGADTGSLATAAQMIARAKRSHVRVFAVGLRSYQFHATTLAELAASTGGVYSEAASPAALEPIYAALSTRLANEYLLRYRSLAGPAQAVRVRVAIPGVPGATTATYTTPALPVKPVPPYHRSLLQRFWVSGYSVFVISIAVALLVALSLRFVVGRRRTKLLTRMLEFVTEARAATKQRDIGSLKQAVLASAERAFSRTPWWERFAEEMEIAQFPVPATQLVMGTIAGTLILGWLIGLVLPPVLALLALGIPFGVRALVKARLARRREVFAKQLPDNLNVLASALRAGHSFVGALSVMLEETEEPARGEFRRALADEQLGLQVEDTLVGVARRMGNAELEQVALVAGLQRQTGGNTAEVLDTVVDTIRERADLRRQVKTLTAQGKMTRWILTLLPIGLALFLTALNSEYMSPLYNTTGGQIMLGLAVAMVIAGSFAIRKIVEIEI